MSAPIPTTEPTTITAGETLEWTKTVPDFPATTHTLKYALQKAGQTALIAITATASGSDYAVAVAASVTVLYTPGVYTWTSYVESGATREVVERGSVTILPAVTTAQASTHATRTLALIEAAIEGRIPNGLESTNIDGQQLDRIPMMDLMRLRSVYQNLVAQEANRAGIAAGLGNRRNHFARFTRPT